jgi:hypothetical protein
MAWSEWRDPMLGEIPKVGDYIQIVALGQYQMPEGFVVAASPTGFKLDNDSKGHVRFWRLWLGPQLKDSLERKTSIPTKKENSNETN